MVAQFHCSEARKRLALVATFAVALCAFAYGPSVWAQEKRKETEGPTYPITEPDMLQGIDDKLKSMQQSGELKKKIDEAVARSTNTAQYPKPVKGLGRVQRTKTYYYDPSVVATKEVRDAKGNVVVAAGSKVNPLEYVAMKEWLIFFDGTDPGQVKIAEDLAKKFEWVVKPILTNGGPMDLMRKWKHRVYFDQGGSMVKQLGIQNVPALVSQEGKVLRIDELSY
ncbi:type-F conjugative transfer system protein TraW [Ottowia sp.]|uniref:type-F conjugative transfer system protein TraW n=1 Tax=Ottowia sp. TaxID=1898956 RepID=UPI0025EB130D|nr:type-F conjugative transfer system protein TraW [Ottowia sp.]MBK6616136.1 type-F conjugative transfer system protein TraW [Ottowia sp.]